MRYLSSKVLVIIWSIVVLNTHPVFSQNFFEDFNCGNVMTAVCGGGAMNCPNWSISHGTPRINQGAVFMASTVTTGGEGIFTEFQFIAGRSYTITYDARSGGNLASLIIRASDDLVNAPHNAGDPCIEPAPTVVSDLINTRNIGNVWTTQVERFNPTINYDQIWLFIDGGLNRNILVDNIEIEEVCGNDEVFSNSTVIPDGLTEVADFIWAGSKQNGSTSGLVTSGVNNQTELKAGDHILFSEDFQSCPSASGYMVAGIADCGQTFSFKRDIVPLSINDPIPDESEEKLTVVYNASTGQPTLHFNLETERDVDVMVINEIGQVIHSPPSAKMLPGDNQIPIPSHQFKSGLYVALVKIGDENHTCKFVIP